MSLIFWGYRVGVVTELEVLCLGKVGDERFTDYLCFKDVLVEVDHYACHATLLIRAEINAVAFNNILAAIIDDVDYTQIVLLV